MGDYPADYTQSAMPNGRVRTARPEDLSPILELEASFPEADRLSRRSLMRLLKSESALCLVSEAENSLLGAAILLFRKGHTWARLYSISVSDKARHHGVGKALQSKREKNKKSK